MLTVQILTKNNQNTILKTLESLNGLKPRILIGDYGSVDDTLDICKKFQAEIFRFKGIPRNEARNRLINISKEDWNLWIEPWESILQNPQGYKKINENRGYVRLIKGSMVTWELRFWKDKAEFINPIFETIDSGIGSNSTTVIASCGGINSNEAIEMLDEWKNSDPMSNKPYYYQSCLFLAQGKYDEFIRMSEHYLFLDKRINMSTTMIRYYQALVQINEFKSVKNSLKKLNLCLCAKPLMAEFWCLTGDVYYHLLHKFKMANEFYENALILGKKRLGSDRWPMDISKYEKYPKMMIDSCNKILSKNTDFIPI